eukprot:scaffold18404_cov58-Phaeocystis_antarctica.AAC.2
MLADYPHPDGTSTHTYVCCGFRRGLGAVLRVLRGYYGPLGSGLCYARVTCVTVFGAWELCNTVLLYVLHLQLLWCVTLDGVDALSRGRGHSVLSDRGALSVAHPQLALPPKQLPSPTQPCPVKPFLPWAAHPNSRPCRLCSSRIRNPAP